MRHWLPELARLPTEWIHHPWDAPESVLKASGVELGLNYPKPIIEIDLARERLTEAIMRMWELEAAAKSAESNGTDEEVVDNSDRIESSAIPKVVLKGRAPCHTVSSNDQRVPSFHNANNNTPNRKRSKSIQEEKPIPDNSQNLVKAGTSRADEDLCSTAESSSAKKQTTSDNLFYVPQSYSMSIGNPSQECESSGVMQPGQEHVDMEQSSSKDGKQSNSKLLQINFVLTISRLLRNAFRSK